jgi:putative transposase
MGRKFFLKCHLIFCIKYRKKILDETFCKHLREIFNNIENKSDFKIDIFEFDKDHVHFLIDYEPQISITSIVRKMKQESTINIWKKESKILSKYFWKEKTFWSDGYYVSSIGNASEETIKKYIEQQG